MPVFGNSPSIFTDYNFAVEETIYGERINDETITVRVQGGKYKNSRLIVEDAPLFEEKEEVVLFLYHPNMGGGYNTKGDYYYILGMNQGVFYPNAQDHNTFMDVYSNSLSISQLKKDVANKSYNDYQWKNELVSNLQQNYESGFISYAEYCTAMEELEEYAQVIP